MLKAGFIVLYEDNDVVIYLFEKEYEMFNKHTFQLISLNEDTAKQEIKRRNGEDKCITEKTL